MSKKAGEYYKGCENKYGAATCESYIKLLQIRPDKDSFAAESLQLIIDLVIRAPDNITKKKEVKKAGKSIKSLTDNKKNETKYTTKGKK